MDANETKIRYSRKKIIKNGLIAFTIFMISFNFFRLMLEEGSLRIFTYLLVITVMVLSFFYLLSALLLVFRKDQAAIVLSDKGLLSYSDKKPGLIPWADIAQAELVKEGSRLVIVIRVKDIAAYTGKITDKKKSELLKSTNIALVLKDNHLKITLPDVLARMKTYLEKYGSNAL